MPGKLCHFCEKRMGRYVGMIAKTTPQGQVILPPHETIACRGCYLGQWRERYPNQPEPDLPEETDAPAQADGP